MVSTNISASFLCIFFIATLAQLNFVDSQHPSTPTQSLTCPEDECSCQKISTYYELQCPPKDPEISVWLESTSIEIDCKTFEGSNYERIPAMTVSGTLKVDIKHCPLPTNTSLPLIIRKMTKSNLITLRFQAYFGRTNQELKDILLQNGMFEGLENLKILDLSFNGIRNIPMGAFNHLINLETLNLFSNSLQHLTTNIFDGAETVLELDLSTNLIENIDKDVFSKLSKLTNINLSANRISTLPEGLFTANKQLRQFRLIHNRIDLPELPEHLLANLPHLANVSIGCNIQRISSTIFLGSCNLTQLSLSRNLLEALPENLLANQTQLTDLDLSNNRLREIPDNLLAQNSLLSVLSVSHNKLEIITDRVFQNLPQLRELYLNDNNLQNINPTAFRKANKIRHLILRNNSITKINTEWSYQNQKLEELDLSFNKITQLNSVDLQTSIDIRVNLSNNHIEKVNFGDLEYMIKAEPNLHSIKRMQVLLEANPVICDCSLLDFVKYLQGEMEPFVKKVRDISVFGVKCAGGSYLTGRLLTTVRKEELLCSDPGIKKCPHRCECSKRIADKALVVNCTNANLTKIPELPKLPGDSYTSLELHIQNNSITELLINSTGYANVTKIFAQNNNISLLLMGNIPTKLRTFDLTNNQLTFINTSVLERLNQTQQLALSRNPWICDCDSIDLVTFIQSRFRIITDYENILCWGNSVKLTSMSPELLCPEKQELLITICVLLTTSVFFISTLIILYFKFELQIKIWLYAHNLCLWFVNEEELDRDKRYDAFLSYAHQDEEIAIQIRDKLEAKPNPLELCIHVRDFIPGDNIQNQIVQCIEESRRTIVILSPDFLRSTWGNFEFLVAHDNAIAEHRVRLIVVVYGDIEIEILPPALKAYLQTNTYVEWGDRWFWEKLRYALPHSSANRQILLHDETQV